MTEPIAQQPLRRGPDWWPAPGPELSPMQQAVKAELRRVAARLFAEYGAAAVNRRKVADMARQDHRFAAVCYPGDSDLLYAVVGEHVFGLNAAVSLAFGSLEQAGSVSRLEGSIRAWLAHVASEPSEHRCLLFCTGLLPEERRRVVQLDYGFAVERVMEAVGAAVPGLAERPEAVDSLAGTARALLSDVWWWRGPVDEAERARVARRITGMLIAAGEAEMAGTWSGVGRAAGVGAGGLQVVESHVARRRMREVMDVAEMGGEVVVTRLGRPVAKVVGVG